MKELFVPFELSLKLKELGFNDKCLATIDDYGALYIKGQKKGASGAVCIHEIQSPTWEQAFNWIEDKYRLNCYFRTVDFIKWHWRIILEDKGQKIKGYSNICKSRFESRESCLDKLIKIIIEDTK